jgi:glycine betaine/proline transport system ATP-binding protein
MDTQPTEKIKTENLTKIFGPHPEYAYPLLDQGLSKEEIRERTGQAVGLTDASFVVNEGEILVIMGLSGCGKSTLIRCLNRLVEPSRGHVWVDGQDITQFSHKELLELRRHKFGMVFQHFALFPHRSILANAEYGLEIQGVERGTREQKAREALSLVGLEGWENATPAQLSGGMQQRVGLARALAVDPDILLMDEAFSALDPLIRGEMQNELVSLQARVKKTIIFITHDLDEALKIGDRIILMKDGGIVQVGTPEEILTRPADSYVERFVEDVDKSKVLTARAVMMPVRAVAYAGDGPRTALHKMSDEHSAGADPGGGCQRSRQAGGQDHRRDHRTGYSPSDSRYTVE